ncbi:hypothetical protein [Streptomyces aureoverticillatus]|uniref:hypothetical protein n=1 Tax=Streptomyces aureoverticillatus TaxID=66871 RepID=UPI0013DA3331|nr:hypothetical protein [Streptomyces aureoverticillatus]QIB43484.1 hypothetical protein G3H79_10755 [Streptomyces aureoverticillatus]
MPAGPQHVGTLGDLHVLDGTGKPLERDRTGVGGLLKPERAKADGSTDQNPKDPERQPQHPGHVLRFKHVTPHDHGSPPAPDNQNRDPTPEQPPQPAATPHPRIHGSKHAEHPISGPPIQHDEGPW